MAIYSYGKGTPKIAPGCFIAPSAEIIGDVRIGDESSVWFNAVIRADFNSIRIGRRVSIQDGCVLHTEKESPIIMENDIVVGHGALIHSAVIGSGTMIGMGSIVLSGARIGKNCIVGAGSVVTEGTFIPDGSIVIGVPGKVVRKATPVHEERVRKNVTEYARLNGEYLKKDWFEKL